MSQSILRAEGIFKRFPGVQALSDARLEVLPGEVHGLIGENGAGKSTLINVISGAARPDRGSIFIHDQPAHIRNPYDAHRLGIRVVFQHLSLVPQLPVVDNLFLGREETRHGLLSRAAMLREAREVLSSFDPSIQPLRRVRDLSASQRYIVEIAKAVIGKPSLLILDEPTASLTQKETDRLFTIVRSLTAEGKGVVWITHRLEELEEIADRATVMRDGQYVITLPRHEIREEVLIRHMIGRELHDIYLTPPALTSDSPDVLEVQGISTGTGLQDVTFTIRRGEVLGVGGLIGSGSERLGPALFGLEPITKGQLALDGRPLAPRNLNPSHLTRSGAVYLPGDRLVHGVIGTMSASKNISLSGLDTVERVGVLNQGKEHMKALHYSEQLDIRPLNPRRRITNFSGGNQQKALLARGMFRRARLFIVEEPTQGIDVGAKKEIYRIIGRLASAGAAVVLISSDLNELLNSCHRIMVFHRGRVSTILEKQEATEELILKHYFGATTEEIPA
jgi:ribose transport system ATP-binding protein